jgi:hypothetical protein
MPPHKTARATYPPGPLDIALSIDNRKQFGQFAYSYTIEEDEDQFTITGYKTPQITDDE